MLDFIRRWATVSSRLPACRLETSLQAIGWAAILLTSSAIADVGRTPGTAGVTPRGEPSYVIPIHATPGINGMTPELAVAYASAGTRGILGIGFTMAGLSAISPCAKTIAQDGAAFQITLSPADQYCLDGQRLRLIGGTHGVDGAQYRTEVDKAMRVTIDALPGQQPTSFRVERSNGLIYSYGANNTARFQTSNSSSAVTFIWALSQIQDRSGNQINIYYENDPTPKLFRPNYIDYTDKVSAGGDYRIDFVYQGADRSDVVTGSKPSDTEIATVEERRLLQRLDLKQGGIAGTWTTYKQYKFVYETGAGSNSRLTSVQECRSSSECLSPTVFTWTSGTAGFGSEVPTSATVASTAFPMDISGDGYDDLVWADGGVWKYMLGSSTGYGSINPTTYAATSPTRALPLEWNADARMTSSCPGATATGESCEAAPPVFWRRSRRGRAPFRRR